jgi:hypothetical protein
MRAISPVGLFRTALAYLLLLSGICVSNNARTQTTITLGAGSLVSSGPSPINLNAPGLRGQFLYTASEILAAGGVPGDSIIALGFDVVSAPLQPLQNYTIHLKHTTNTDVSTFDYGTSGPLQTVLTLPSYLPNTSGFDMLTLDSAFFWNGTDNLLVEVCYYTPSGFGQGGDLRYDNVPNRFTYQTGSTDLCPLSTLTNLSVNGVLPQLQLTFATAASQPSIAVTPDSLALNTLTCDDVIDTSLLISNTGTAPLSWTVQTQGNLTDDFEGGSFDSDLWQAITGGFTTSAGCGVANGSFALYFDGATSRIATTNPFLAFPGDQVQFSLVFGTSLSSPCENADPGEDVVLEYSVNGGSWQFYRTYDTEDYPFFTTITEPIPVLGQPIRLRWRQVFFNGSCCDHWSLDDVTIPNLGFGNSQVVVTPDSGTIAPGGSQLVTLSFDLTGLPNDTYSFTLQVLSNDLSSPQIDVPVSITVNGQADLVFLDSCVVFDTVMQFTSATDTFTLRNAGCDSLTLNNITSTDLAYTVPNFTPTTLGPGDSATFAVTFAPTAVQPYPAALIVSSSLGTDSLCVSGVGGGAPVAQVSPDSLVVTIASCDDSVTLPLQVINVGTGGMNWSLDALGGGVTFEDSSQIFFPFGSASTFHTFSGWPGNPDSLRLTITINGDYDSGTEFANLLIEGTFIQQIPDGNVTNGVDIVFTIVLGGPQMAAWLADGQLQVEIDNSSAVDLNIGAGQDFHKVKVETLGAFWLRATPSLGTTLPGDTTTVQVQFSSSGLTSGIYSSDICLTSNDPLTPQVCIPTQLTVIGAPAIAFSDACAELDTVQQFTSATDTVWLINTGCDSLDISGLAVSDTTFSVQPGALVIAAGDSTPLAITFAPSDTGQYSATLDVFNNAGDTTLCLQGYSAGAPVIGVIPDSIQVTINGCDDSVQLDLQVLNTGLGALNWQIGGTAGNVYDSTSLQFYSTAGASTVHQFSGLPPGVDTVVLTITLNGDYDGGTEFATLLVEGFSFGTIPDGNVSNGVDITFTQILTGSQLSSFLADGLLVVTIQNSNAVDDNVGGNDSHRVQVQASGANWLSATPLSGSTAVGDTSVVPITLSSAGLIDGTYQANVCVSANDPQTPQVCVPVSLTVIGTPEIALPDSCLAFPPIMQFTEATDSVWVRNPGCDTLFVSQVTGGGDAFNADTTSFAILPGDSLAVPITFSPDTVGSYSGVMTFVSDAGDSTICVTGSAFGAPTAVVAPPSLNVTLPGCADSLSVPLTVYNQGLSDLGWILGSDCNEVVVAINTGSFGFEVSWQMVDGQNVVVASGSGYANFSSYQDTFCIPAGNYSFRAFDSFGDGWNGGTATVSACTGNLLFVNTFTSGSQATYNLSVPTCLGAGTLASWLSLTPSQDSTAAGDSTVVQATFSSQGLVAGVYADTLFLISNDPLNSPIPVPVTLNITGAVSIAFSDTLVQFDSTFVGFTDQQSLVITNALCDTMEVLSLSNSDPVFGFTAPSTPFLIAPYDTLTVPLTFAPTAIGPYLDSLLVSYRAKDSTTTFDSLVYLQGVGVGTPILAFAPDSINASLNACIDSVTFPVTLYSNGSGTVNWTGSVSASSANLQDDFEGGAPNNALWSLVQGGFIGVGCGTANGAGALYFNGGTRQATTVPLAATGGGSINFALRIGSAGGSCENADPSEEVVLEYSLDGIAWQLIREYHVDSFTVFTPIQETIPVGAASAQTQFRWRQKGNSGSSYDHWAIDDVSITTGTDSSLQVSINPSQGSIPAGDSTVVLVTIAVSQLNNGQYPVLVELLSNDPADSVQYIPGLITITGQPEIGLNPASGEFCFGDSIQLTADLSGQLNWSTGQTTQSIFAYQSDSITVALTYPNGCTIRSLPAVVEELPQITSSIVLSGVGANCAGNVLDLSVSGGTPGYNYLWSTGATTQDITISAPGTFDVLITDNANCIARDTLQIDSLNTILLSTLVTDVLCNGNSTGVINLTVSGGDFPYTYLWSNGATTEDLMGLSAGTYSVTVTDNNGCTATTTVQVSQPSALGSFISKGNVSCPGGSNGAINLFVGGGTAPYSYQWSNGATTQDQIGLTAGVYTVTITDLNGCTATNATTISEPPPITITEVSSDSCGLASLDISVSGGGNPFYFYQWSNGATSQDLVNVPPGTYTVTVTNFTGCTATASFAVSAVPPPPTPTISVNGDLALCSGDSVTLTSSATQNLLWNTGDTTASLTLSAGGSYTVSVTDAAGCTSTSAPVDVTVLPDAFISASANPICNGQTIALTVNNASSALWSTGDTTLSITVSPSVATAYSVGAVNDSGCAYVDTVTVGVLPAVPPDSVLTMLPADGAVGQTQPLTLSWPSANNASAYDLFIWPQGTAQPAAPTVSGVSVNQFVINSLSYGVTYDWQVVATNNCFSTPGVIQRFTIEDLPDLVVDTILVPGGTLFAGQNICINWRTRNQGLGDANGTWTERVYLSQNQVYDPGLDPLVGTVTNTAALAAGDTSTLQQVCFDLPDCILGNYYVFVFVDVGFGNGQILESDESNNTGLNANNPMSVDLPPQPDLQVTNFFRVGSGPLASGGQLFVQWTVTNLGDSLTNVSSWTDRLYLTTDSIFDPNSAVQVYDYQHTGALDSAQSYTVNDAFQLPGFVDGRYFLFLETDALDDVDECSPGDINEQNNVSDGDTIETFLAPPPDLVATNVSAGLPDTLVAGGNLAVTWTTQNQGLAQTLPSTWRERIFLRPVGGGPAIVLGTFSFSATLVANYSVNRSQTVSLPSSLNGDYEVCVLMDVFDQVYEYTGETNNQTCAPGLLTVEQPDLVISSLVMPAVDSTGNPLPVTYYQKNLGPADLSSATFRDRLYWTATPGGAPLALAALPIYSNTNLPAGDSILRTASVSVPNNQSGVLYLCIQTDWFNGIAESNESNNTTCGAAVEVNRPDFVVSSINAPSLIQAGDTFSLDWTTLNQGSAGVFGANWTDCVFFSATPTYNPNAVIPLADLNYGGDLIAGGDTTNTVTLTVGAGLAGTYYLGVFADCNDDLDEANQEGNNVLILSQPVQVVVPDLIVSRVSIPPIDSTGAPFTATWVVQNAGLGDVINGQAVDRLAWTDSLGGTLTPISTVNWSTSLLASGDSLVRTATITPPAIAGPWYLCVTTDEQDQINESDELNNTGCSDSLRILRPDLVVGTIAAPGLVQAAQPFTVNWTSVNQGEVGLANGFWTDCVFLSPTPSYDPATALTIGQSSYGASLAANGGSSAQQTLATVPYGFSGLYYLGVFTDCGNAIGELNQEGNNALIMGAITVEAAPAADLIPSINSLLPDTLTAGSSFTLDFSVSNQGDTTAFGLNWFDGVYLTPNPAWNGDPATASKLDSLPHFSPLAVGSSYSQSTTVGTDPLLPAGWYYIYLYTDDAEQVYEDTLEDNNWVGDSIYIEAYPPIDLEATTFAADSVAILPGNSLTVDYQVSNVGQGMPLVNSWSDGVYLSTDSIWDVNDQLLTTVIVPGQVPPGTSYARFNETVNIPLGTAAGPYCLLLVADAFLTASDVDTSNNYRCDSIFVKPTVYPDLQVSSFSCPGIGTAGQPITLNFTVENDAAAGGPTNTGGWSEGFFLQTAGGPIFLGSAGYTGNLASGASYSGSVTLTLPITLPAGFYDIVMRTDRSNIVFEDQNEGNNEAICNLQIDATPPADLIVSSITRPDTAFAGKALTIGWTVRNDGLNPANGTMTQGVYISADTLFSANDVFFGSISGPVNLAPGDSASYSLSGDLLGVPEGCFHVLVRTDVLNNIIEASDTNNLRASPCMEVQIPLLPFNVLTPDTLINQQELYYRIEVDSSLIGESMIVTLTGDSANNAFNEEYLRYGTVPTRTVYDYTVDFPFQANQTVIAPDIEFGTYYHLTYGQTNGSNEQDITLLAEILPFDIRKVMVNYGGNTGPVTVKIEGGRFEPGMEARLESPTLGTIVATNVIYINSTALWATFDLVGRPLGVYDVGLYKGPNSSVGLDTALLDSGFTVQQGPANGFIGGVIPGTCSPGVSEIGQLLQVVVDHPPNTRPNRTVSMTIYYENIGNVDLPIPTRFLLSTGGAPIGFTPGELSEGKTELFLEFTEAGSPPGLLRPGGKGSITVYSRAIAPLTFELFE